MRFFVALAVFVLAFLVVASAARRQGTPVEGAPVVVYAADPVRVVLPISASENLIVGGLQDSLEERAKATANPIVREQLLRLRESKDRLDRIASRSVQRFDSGQAAALAFSLYSAEVTSEDVTIVSVTAELIPNYRGLAKSRDHEDGHALINSELARRCGPGIAHRLIARGLGGAWLENAIIVELHEVGDAAHDVYHLLVQNATLGAHQRHARAATDQIVESQC